MRVENLKPCPDCGRHAIPQKYLGYYLVLCHHCQTSSDPDYDEEIAMQNWQDLEASVVDEPLEKLKEEVWADYKGKFLNPPGAGDNFNSYRKAIYFTVQYLHEKSAKSLIPLVEEHKPKVGFKSGRYKSLNSQSQTIEKPKE